MATPSLRFLLLATLLSVGCRQSDLGGERVYPGAIPVADGGEPLSAADADVPGDAFESDAFVANDAAAAVDASVEPESPEEPEPEPAPEPESADPVDGPSVVQTTYRVMQWNIAGGKENDCRTAGIARAVLRFIREKGSQFISLNEVCRSQYEAIRDALADRWGKTTRFSAFAPLGRVGVAIFSRFDLRDVFEVKIGEDSYGDRKLLCARMRTREHMRFCATHLSPGAGRRVQLSRVMSRLENWWDNRRDTVILAGDFNLEPNDSAFDEVYASGANHPDHNPANRGAYRELDDGDRGHCLGYGENTGMHRSGGGCGNGRRIDLIFARANRIVDGRYGSDTVNVPTDCTGACSDHRAVFGWVRLRVRVD